MFTLRRPTWLFLAFLTVSAPRLVFAGEVLDRIVAVVNDEIILLSDLDQMAIPTFREQVDPETPEGRRRFDAHRRKVLDSLVEKQLVAQQAKEMKVAVTEDEVRKAVDEVKKNNNLDDAQFQEALKGQGFTMASYRTQLRQQMVEMRVVNQAVRSKISVSDDEIRAHYAQTARQASGDETQVHLRQIFLALAKDASEAKVEARRKDALRLVEELRTGADFATLAKQKGEDPLAKSGGDLGWLSRGDLPDSLKEVVAGMEKNDVRGPIRSDRGLHIIQLVDKKEASVRAFDEVKDTLRQQLYQQQFEKGVVNWTKELRRKAHVDIRL